MADPSIMFGGFKAGADTGDGRTCGCCGTDACGVLVCVSACPTGDPVVGATVTINGFTPCTTGPGGCCVVNIGVGGTYTLTVTATGYQTWSGTMTMHCSQLIPIELRPNTDPPSVTFNPQGCCLASAPNTTVTLSDGQSQTTGNAGGNISFSIATAGTYTYTATSPRFDPLSGSFTIPSDCYTTTINIDLPFEASSGYICTGWCAYPLPTTLHYSDTMYGALAIVYDGVSLFIGNGVASYAGGCGGCPPQTSEWIVEIDASCFTTPLAIAQLQAGIIPPHTSVCPVPIGDPSTGAASAGIVVDSWTCFPFVLNGTINNCNSAAPLIASNGYAGASGSTTSVTITE